MKIPGQKTISRIISWTRIKLNKIRSQEPEKYDYAFKWITFLIPFFSCFAPALVTKNWLRAILEFVLLSIILVFQWSSFTNKINEKEVELINTKKLIQDLNSRIIELENDSLEYGKWIEGDEHHFAQEIQTINGRFDELAGFSHAVSDKVKKITAEIEKPVDRKVVSKITSFFQESLSSLEKLLSEHYGKEIRSSIKIVMKNVTLMTFARGRNNIISRGGEYKCSEYNKKEIAVDSNYAYIAIVRHEQQFFAEGNLLEIHNKFEDDDVFFCEYGDDYLDLFASTIVMPIRIPVYSHSEGQEIKRTQEVMGILCIDCKTEMPDWSDRNIRNQRGYHIIADYADSLAILVKEYKYAKEK